MRILFCGGGTAGHVYPNIAIAETFLRNEHNTRMAYVTTENGIENELVNFKKYRINVIGLKRALSIKNIKCMSLLIKGIKDCKKIIREFRPDIIIGTGGYATFPVIYAGYKLGIKTVMHESNLIPGKAIKHLEKIADKIFVNFEESKMYFKNKDKVIRTGNPIRQGYYLNSKSEARKKLNIIENYVVLCFGGSLGATKINESAIELIDNLIKYRNDITLIWATGKKEYNEMQKRIKEKGLDRLKNLKIYDYISNMPETLASADIVICRAGAMTISEVALCSKATIFIPSPNVTNNHQYKNARILADNGCAELIREDELYKLTDNVRELLEKHEKRKQMEDNIQKFAVPDANKIMYKEILYLLNK